MQTKQTKLFGKDVTIKNLTIGDILEIQNSDLSEIEKSVMIISKGTGLSIDEIKNADLSYIDDFAKATDLILGNKKK
jgi:hypothetical protein